MEAGVKVLYAWVFEVSEGLEKPRPAPPTVDLPPRLERDLSWRVEGAALKCWCMIQDRWYKIDDTRWMIDDEICTYLLLLIVLVN